MNRLSGHQLLLTALICIWAVSWPVTKVGVAVVPPIWFGFLRYLIGGSLLFAWVVARGRLKVPERQDWRLIFVSGALQMAGFSACTGIALTRLPPGRASVIAYTTPLWVVPIAAAYLKEPISRTALLGVAVGLLGAMLIAAPSFYPAQRGDLIGYALLMAAAALWALSILYVRAHRFVASPLELAPWQMLVAAVLLLPAAAVTEGSLRPISGTGLLALAYVGPIATALAYWAMVEVGRNLPASTVSMGLLATPGLGILISTITLGETLSASLIGGLVLVCVGIRLAASPRISNHAAEGAAQPA